MQPKRELRQIDSGQVSREKLMNGAKKMYEAVSSTYGADGMNVLIELPFGDPTLTRDGVTVAKRVSGVNLGLPDRVENMAASLLRQASEKTNRTAGDGTTATIVLAYHLLIQAMKLVAVGEKPRIIQKQLIADSKAIIEWLQSETVAAKNHLHQVATVSSGDELIGKLIADTVEEVGHSGGISIRERNYPVMDVEKVNGYYFDKGFAPLTQQVEYDNPRIFVSSKHLATATDIVPLLNYAIEQGKVDGVPLVIIGEVSGDALNTLLVNLMNGNLNAVVIPPPAFGESALPFIEDISIYTGATVHTDANSPADISDDIFGSASKVQISQDRAILYDGAGDSDAISSQAADITAQAAKETNEHRKLSLEQRYSKLVGKIAIVNVGGSTQAEMEQLKYRVEDAIEATKSAMADGILPGGATVLVHLATHLNISPVFAAALNDTFKKLMDNAAEDPGYRLKQVQKAKLGFGFNLRDMTEEPIDLRKAGIFDATRSVIQTIENATSAAGSLLTTNATVTIVDTKDSSNGEQSAN